MRKLVLGLALAALASTASAQEVVVKLGTLAPNGSTWHNLLKEMGEKWAEASGGRVKLRIYAGGTQGSEGDMVRKMAVGQLQAAAITNVGMHDIVKEPQAISAPGVIESEAEFNRLLQHVLTYDVESDKAHRLANVLAQRRARFLLSRADDLFS